MRKPYIRYQDLTGMIFSRLTVIDFADNNGPESERSRWNCACECGAQLIVTGKRLRSGNTRSCGCLRRDEARKRIADLAVINSSQNGLAGTTEYRSWESMIARCTHNDHEAWHNYGGRGIVICERWQGENGFKNFIADMGTKPSIKHSLDRFPNIDGNYEPKNCRWATAKEQGRNTRVNLKLTLNGVTHCLIEWAEITGLKRTTISQRLLRGWSIEKALTTPIAPARAVPRATIKHSGEVLVVLPAARL